MLKPPPIQQPADPIVPSDEHPRWLTLGLTLVGKGEEQAQKLIDGVQWIGKRFPEMYSYAHAYNSEDTPWCGCFVAYCFAKCDIRPMFGPDSYTRWMWADAWSGFGAACEMQPGAVAVMEGHVAFIAGPSRQIGKIVTLNGNYSDKIMLAHTNISDIRHTRWPATSDHAPLVA